MSVKFNYGFHSSPTVGIRQESRLNYLLFKIFIIIHTRRNMKSTDIWSEKY